MTNIKNSDWRGTALLWEKYHSPFRPSIQDIKNYTASIKFRSNMKVLLLGATPEIRKIFSNLKINFIIADFSARMINAMLIVEKKIDYEHEIWIKVNWLKMGQLFRRNYFDYILGDLVLRNIDHAQSNNFFYTLSLLLSRNGCLLFRIHHFDKTKTSKRSKELIRKAFDNYSHFSQGVIEDTIVSELFDKHTDKTSATVDRKAFDLDVKNYLNKFARTDRERKMLSNILKKWGGGQKTWTQRNEEEIVQLICNHFQIMGIKYSQDYPTSTHYPLYILKKKKRK
jgi:hypothetical protein